LLLLLAVILFYVVVSERMRDRFIASAAVCERSTKEIGTYVQGWIQGGTSGGYAPPKDMFFAG
jgi:hypothetical protein